MPYDLEGTAIYPLSDLLPAADFALADFIPTDALATVFDGLYYTDASSYERGGNVVLNVQLALETELKLTLPGCDAFALVFGSAGAGWTAVHLEIVIGPDFAVAIREATVGLRISETVLKDVATGGPAEIQVQGDITFSANGITIENAIGASLAPAYLCGTQLVVEALDVRPVFGVIDPPAFVTDETFQGITFERLAVTFPAEYLQVDAGQNLQIAIEDCAIGTTGFTGQVSVTSPDPANPITGLLLGFPFRFRRFGVDIRQNAILDTTLGAEVRIAALEEGNVPKWIAVDFAFGADGSFSGSLAVAQPPGSAGSSTSLISAEFANVVRMGLDAVRVTKHGPVWAFFFSGRMKLLLSGAVTWPEVVFDEIGFDSDGKFLLPDGAGIGFASPMVVDWHFVKLTISKFRFGYADNTGDWLQIALSAEIMLIDGLPAGASVEGLTVKWRPQGGVPAEVSFNGIGISFGVPGTFNASIAVSYTEAAGAIEFRGKGKLELTALDMSIEIGIVVGHQSVNLPANPEAFAYLYLFADAKLLPTGIPIAQTGVSIYGFQGLIAYNMGLAINQTLPPDERFYELFTRAPIGITDVNKWERRHGQNALGVGVVLGTADKGFCINVKGLLVVAFPDVTILLQARANFIKLKPDLGTAQEGTLDALMVYASGQSTLSLDILARWEIPVIVSIAGSARAFFSFTDASAWYLEIGRDQDGKRVVAQVLNWGNGWLFNAGFWFRLDGRGLVTGAQISLELRAEAGGFWVSVGGSARGEMALYWQPMQWEGSLEMSGHIRAGFHGISIGIALSGNARARVKRPFDVHLHVEACVDLFLATICKGIDFDWQHLDPPLLEPPIRRWAATPRHWTPYDSGPAGLVTGVVALEPGTNNEPVIHPHSLLTLDFAKAMVDSTAAFNESVALDDNGYRTIGERSGWSAAFRVDSVALVRRPGAANETAVPLWGTWARETLEPNTTLRLLSSERFGHDGSLTSGFMEEADLDYCDAPVTTIYCAPLTELEPGFGRIDDGPLYHWETGGGSTPGGATPPAEGPVLGPDDTFEVSFPGPVTDVTVEVIPSGKPLAPNLPGWLGRFCEIPACHVIRSLLIAASITVLTVLLALLRPAASPTLLVVALVAGLITLVLLLLLWVCRCRNGVDMEKVPPSLDEKSPSRDSPSSVSGEQNDDNSGTGTKPGDTAGTIVTPQPTNDGTRVVVTSGDAKGGTLARICWARGHGTPDWSDLRTRGGSTTQYESWTVPAEQRLLAPNERFELRVGYTALRRAPNGGVDTPLGAPTAITAKFRTGGPPDRGGALANYIARVQPADGTRPVYTGYDLRVQFFEDYVPHLYAGVGEQLMIRLFDGQGNPLLDANGLPLLVPATEVGPTERTTSQRVWEDLYRINTERGCISGPPIRTESETVLRVDAATSPLTPNSQYVAQLVSDSRPAVALASWSFTTARFATFTELVTMGRLLPRPVRTAQTFGGADFDALARTAGVPTVRYADAFTVTPILNAGGDRCIGVLLESPEPLESGTRLSVTVDGVSTDAIANLDTTRVFLRRPGGADWNGALLPMRLVWRRDAGAVLPKLTVNGVAGDEVVTFELDARSQP